MRRLASLVLLLLAAPMTVQAAMTVPIDQSRRVPLGGVLSDVIVGNKAIADVAVIDGRNLMVVGKKLGVTNLVVLGAGGKTLFDGEIVVSAGAGSVVSIRRGEAVADYACTPYCQQVAGDAAPPTLQTPAAPATQGPPTATMPPAVAP